MLSKRIIAVLVSNDLATDQRVMKVCESLYSWGLSPVMIGRLLPTSIDMPKLPYAHQRLNLLFSRGPLFYVNLNVRLFLKLLFMKIDGIHANDLDTLPAAFLASRIRRKPLVYDTHEYFTGVPELVRRPFVRNVWKRFESFIFPKLKDVFTVNDSIADLYEKDYGIRPHVMRNIPRRRTSVNVSKSRADFGIPEDRFVLILQGSGINVDRGGEEAVEMMQYLPECLLVIAGSGDVLEQLKQSSKDLNLEDRVKFFPRMPYAELMALTAVADLGLTLDKDTNINYRFSLPNKLFDYIHAGIPVLASDLHEVSKIVRKYKIGVVAKNHFPEHLASDVRDLLEDTTKYQSLKENCLPAQEELCWENEVNALQSVYSDGENQM